MGGETQWGAPTTQVTRSFNHKVLWGNVTNYIFYTYTRPLATKHGKELTYHEGLLLINSYHPLNMWSQEVLWQTKNISPLSQCLWSLNLLGFWYTVRSSHPLIRLVPQWGGIARSLIKYIISPISEDPWTPN